MTVIKCAVKVLLIPSTLIAHTEKQGTMSNKKRFKPLTAAQLNALPITVSEASKLLGPVSNNLSEEYIAQRILSMSEIARILIQTLHLHK